MNKQKKKWPWILGLTLLLCLVATAVFGFAINHWSVTVRLEGDQQVSVEYGEAYADPGAKAYFHGSLIFKNGWSVPVTVTKQVDWTKTGEGVYLYQAKLYKWEGSAKRTVMVVDTKEPEIELFTKDGFYTIPGNTYEEEGFQAIDNYDGDLTEQVVREEKDGKVYYTVTDSHGNVAQVVREIYYWDPTPPELTLQGEETIYLEYKEEYQEPGYIAQDNIDGDLTEAVVLEGMVDSSTLGTYTLTYSVTDSYEHTVTAERTIICQDTKAPKITLKGDSTIKLDIGEEYKEPGYEATDQYDGDVTASVTVEGTVNKERVGKYILTYSVTDSNGNTATKKRTVFYKEDVPPVITLKGDKKITITAGDKFSDPGYSAQDNYDGNLTSSVKVSGSVNRFRKGTYTLTYTVKDSSGNTATAKRTVTVKGLKQQNVVTPNGKVIYLTFDDGPSKHTERLLGILESYNVKATFFTVNTGYNFLMGREAAAGHTVAIHSSTHKYSKIYASEEAYFEDLYQQQELIRQKTGIISTLIRFPGGSSNRVSAQYCTGIMTSLTKAVTDMGFQYFDWNVDSRDASDAKTAEAVYQNVINGVQKHNISNVLMHDTNGYTVDAVEDIIVWGLANGYVFLPLDATSPAVHHTVSN